MSPMAMRLMLAAFLLLISTPALADPCKAIPDRGPPPSWAKPGFIVAGQVRYVGDGDSICVGKTADPATWVEIRLADFYAPELNEPGGREAKALLERVARGQPASCTAVRGKGGRAVSYDRLIATCRVRGEGLAQALRRAGAVEGGRGR